MTAFSSWFWNDQFWLPNNLTWTDLQNTEEHTYPQASDLYIVFLWAILISLIRLVFERFLARPLGRRMSVSEKCSSRAQSNPVLERVFTSTTRHPDQQRLVGLAKQLDWSTRMVERWFRHRRNQEQPSLLTKYQEASWRFTAYLIFNIYAVYIIHDEPWFWDISYCWPGYPFLILDPDIRNLYIAELAFYWSLLFSQFFDVKRKDFLIIAFHHLATIALISFSWCINGVRIGILIMFCHDVSDIFLELAKVCNYAKKQAIADFLFITFGFVFAVSRIVVYPFRILRSVFFEYPMGNWPSYWTLALLLLCLQVMHLIWFSMILKAAFKLLKSGKVTNDPRSDCEENSSGEEGEVGKEEDRKDPNGTQLNDHQAVANNNANYSNTDC